MTTAVTIMIEGSFECEVKILNPDGTDSSHTLPRIVQPSNFVRLNFGIGESISIKEITS